MAMSSNAGSGSGSEVSASSGDGDNNSADKSSQNCCDAGCGDCCGGSNDVKINIDFSVNMEGLPEGMGVTMG